MSAGTAANAKTPEGSTLSESDYSQLREMVLDLRNAPINSAPPLGSSANMYRYITMQQFRVHDLVGVAFPTQSRVLYSGVVTGHTKLQGTQQLILVRILPPSNAADYAVLPEGTVGHVHAFFARNLLPARQ